MKRVLITGASGFIGRHCLGPLLERGYEVHAVFSKNAPELKHKPNSLHWHQVDLLNPEQVSSLITQVEPSYLLHLAWYAVPGKYWTSAENLRWVEGSLHLLRLFAEAKGQRAVVAGTCAEYDWGYGYCVENLTPLTPATLYGACKHALQTVLQSYATQAGLSLAWGRVFFLYGPYEYPNRLVASVIRSLLAGEPARCSHGNQIRDFLHVQDVARAFVALLESDVTGPVNIASGYPIPLKEVITKIAAQLNQLDLVQLGAIPAPANDPPLLVADTRRLQQEVHWQPEYNLETGLAQTIEWWARSTTS